MFKHKLIFYLMTAMLICFMMTSTALAVNLGKISGKVVDRETGEPLPTVAVSVAGTNIGALTDVNGQYIILNVPVGDYDIKAELVGYQPIEKQGVFVSVDLTTYVDFEMTSRAIDIGEIQVVQAERPLVITDQTSTLRLVSGEEVRNLPTDDYQDVIGLNTGVVAFSANTSLQAATRGGDEVSNNPTLNIRGGRQNEVAYLIDGFDTKDPLTGTATTTINNNAIEEVSIVTGGFNAEYGWIASGAINVSTKEGAKSYSGNIEGITSEITDDYGYNTFRFDLAGPIFPDNEQFSFFVSGERRTRLDREPRATNDGEPLGHNDLRGWTWQGKMRYDVTNAVQLRFGVLGSIDKWNQYIRSYAFDLHHAPRFEDKNNSFYLQLTHNLSKTTFYTLKGNYFQTSRFQGDGTYREDIWSYIRPTGNPTFDDTRLYRSYDDPETHYQACCPDLSWCSEVLGPDDLIEDHLPDTLPCNVEDLEFRYEYALNYDEDDDHNFIEVTGDSTILNEDYVYDDFTKRKSSYYGLDFDLTHQINSFNEIKIGFEYQRHTLRYIRHATPASSLYKGVDGGGLLDIDNYGYEVIYTGHDYVYDTAGAIIDSVPNGAEIVELDDGWNAAKNPYTFALYLQDKFEWEGLVVNAGLRFDYLNVNTQRLRNEDNPLNPDSLTEGEGIDVLTVDDLEDAEAETRLSPRLGIGFPITDRTVFHLYYGKFFQRPELQYLYVSYDYLEYMVSSAPYYNPIGNPNLEPEETTEYEVGIVHQLGDNTRFDLTAYYKDVKNLTQVINQPATPFSFGTYRNQDYGTIKGLELALKMRRTRNIAFDLAYTLSYASGTGSYATTQQNIAWTNSERPLRVSPLTFDQRHKITAVVDVRSRRGEGPRMGEFFPLENAGLNVVFSIASGTPYSPMDIYDEVTLASVSPTPAASTNSRYGPWIYRMDLKANKMFKIADLNFDLYVWILNVFDTENAIDVYEGTGDPDNTGWLATDPGQEFIETHSDPDPVTGLTGEEKYQFKQRDPRNYDTPRQIRVGARLSF